MNSLIISSARQSIRLIHQATKAKEPDQTVIHGQPLNSEAANTYLAKSDFWSETPLHIRDRFINFGPKELTRSKIKALIDQYEYIYYLPTS